MRKIKLDPLLQELKDTRKQTYTNKSWEERESLYIQAIEDMDIPEHPSPVDIKEIIHRMDVVFSQAKLDYALFKKYADVYDNRIYVKTKDYIIKFRQSGEAKSDEMAKSLATVAINEEDVSKNSVKKKSLYDMVNLYKMRLTFIDTIIGIINAKQRVLVTENGILKLESSFDGDDNS